MYNVPEILLKQMKLLESVWGLKFDVLSLLCRELTKIGRAQFQKPLTLSKPIKRSVFVQGLKFGSLIYFYISYQNSVGKWQKLGTISENLKFDWK